jgi:hypothetical protein
VGARTFECEGFSLLVPGDWNDITDELDAGSPTTLALPDGIGALQFSCARYVSGVVPAPTSADLDVMLRDFAAANDLGQPREFAREDGRPTVAAATFSQPDAVVRVWYVSDGRNFAKVTYTCMGSQLRDEELRDCESIVRSLRWPDSR